MATTYKTEIQVYAALAKRFAPPAFAVLPGVANGTGGHKRRTIDAMVMSLWPSRGLTLEAVEIKVSRGDYLRELKDPAKAEPIIKYCDRFWLAVGDAKIVQNDLPQTWGLLVPHRGSLKIAKEAPKLSPEPMTRAFLAAIMRRANEALEGDEIRRRIRGEVEGELREEMEKLRSNAMSGLVKREVEKLRSKAKEVARFEKLSGLTFHEWATADVERAAKIVRTLREGNLDHLVSTERQKLARIQAAGQHLIDGASRAEQTLDQLKGATLTT